MHILSTADSYSCHITTFSQGAARPGGHLLGARLGGRGGGLRGGQLAGERGRGVLARGARLGLPSLQQRVRARLVLAQLALQPPGGGRRGACTCLRAPPPPALSPPRQ